ncbi:trypsin-like peptidase domain-containing protein [uncultured Methanobrevibacter sp.]|uniref:S1C family serine protease n=1 Tax=uncultured Methanobrevibacter sp. TaxID=253161 RepID=UPI002605E11C
MFFLLSIFKFLTIIAIILAFLAGIELSYIFLNKNDTSLKNGEENSLVYNSCSNCMSGTMVIENGGLSQTVNKVYDSVVMIKNYQKGKLAGSGSGFVYKVDDKYGYIMTNQHVVDGSTSLSATFTSGEEVDAELLGGDKYMDIAVLRVPVKNIISVAKIGSTEELQLGESVIAIGTPVGEEYYNTVTGGHISGLNRKVTVSVESKDDWVQDVIQIDASINPGNSGGALVNINGEIIGVTSLKLVNDSIEGMGFAIKIEDAMKHIDDLENGRKIERPLLGITHVNVTETALLNQYNVSIDSSIEEGIAVLSVVDGSSADKAGIKKGDVIIEIDGSKVTNTAYLRYLLYKHNIGDTIKVKYIRGKEEITTEVTLTQVAD